MRLHSPQRRLSQAPHTRHTATAATFGTLSAAGSAGSGWTSQSCWSATRQLLTQGGARQQMGSRYASPDALRVPSPRTSSRLTRILFARDRSCVAQEFNGSLHRATLQLDMQGQHNSSNCLSKGQRTLAHHGFCRPLPSGPVSCVSKHSSSLKGWTSKLNPVPLWLSTAWGQQRLGGPAAAQDQHGLRREPAGHDGNSCYGHRRPVPRLRAGTPASA